jgi:hypothetical protein
MYIPLKNEAELRRTKAVLLTRKTQLERALHALTVDGHFLMCYLEGARRELVEGRAKANPDDVRVNTELFAEVNLLDRLISEWSSPKERLEHTNEQIKKIQKELDNQ